MKRLIEKTVFCGLVTAWRFAAWPTNRSPLFVNATIDGVVRAPSLFSKTTGSPPSITAMQELVVPKSRPKTLAIIENSFLIPSPSTNGVVVARLLVKLLILQQALGQVVSRGLNRSLRGSTIK